MATPIRTPLLGEGLAEEASRLIPGGVNSATRRIGPPWAFGSAKGARVTDLDGRSYLDYHAAFGAMLLGHGDDRVTDAAARAMQTIDLVGLGTTELEVEFARRIVDAIPSAEMVVATMSGSESVLNAIRLARGATGRPMIIKFQGCFHGSYDPVARNVISTAENAYGYDPNSSGVIPEALTHTLIAEFNDLPSVRALFDEHPDQIAAVILEPVPHNVGALLPEQEFLAGLRDLTTRHGAVLIFDEVITGFRHAVGGYQELCGITPDLTTFGKSLGNGHAVAGFAGRADLMNQFTQSGGTVMLAGTFNGNAASMAAALATLEVISDPAIGFHAHVNALGDRMRSGMSRIVDQLGIPAVVTGIGSVFVTYFLDGPVRGYRDLLRNNDHAYAEFHRRMIDEGFLMYPMSLKRNHISLAHTADDIDATLVAAEDVLAAMVRDGEFAHA